MTLKDRLNELEGLRAGLGTTPEAFNRFTALERSITRTMAKQGLVAILSGDTAYIRYNNSLTVFAGLRDASMVEAD